VPGVCGHVGRVARPGPTDPTTEVDRGLRSGGASPPFLFAYFPGQEPGPPRSHATRSHARGHTLGGTLPPRGGGASGPTRSHARKQECSRASGPRSHAPRDTPTPERGGFTPVVAMIFALIWLGVGVCLYLGVSRVGMAVWLRVRYRQPHLYNCRSLERVSLYSIYIYIIRKTERASEADDHTGMASPQG
jgi:hypothetical protein